MVEKPLLKALPGAGGIAGSQLQGTERDHQSAERHCRERRRLLLLSIHLGTRLGDRGVRGGSRPRIPLFKQNGKKDCKGLRE